MLNRRFHPVGLFVVLLALMVQLGAGASVPRIDPVTGVAVLCHAEHGGGRPSKAPLYPGDCLACSFCAALNGTGLVLVPVIEHPLAPAFVVVGRTALPPPSTAPPITDRAPGQPRAPPILS
ncbi:hypothetical protein [Rhodopila sp.]|uniref:hypothetical protein n=1 Tax=Rhodopila sp. TaxID=2480087 RepID=UPI003D0FDD7F